MTAFHPLTIGDLIQYIKEQKLDDKTIVRSGGLCELSLDVKDGELCIDEIDEFFYT